MQDVRMSARLRDRITRAGDSGSVYLDTGALSSSEIVSFVFFVFYIFSSPPCCTPYTYMVRAAQASPDSVGFG